MVVQGSGSAAATSVAIPAHAIGDMILIFARGTAAAPERPGGGGTVPAWATAAVGSRQLDRADRRRLRRDRDQPHERARGRTRPTSACWCCGPTSPGVLSTAAARSSVGNGNNTQTIIYPALTLADCDGSSWGVRVGTRGVAITAVGTAPSGWTNQIIQPAGASALMSVHTRSALVANPTADTVTVTSSNSAYRAVTVEILEIIPAQNRTVSGIPSGQAFGSVAALAHQKVPSRGCKPTGYVATIVAATTLVTKSQTIVGGKRVATLGVVTPTSVVTTRVDVAGVGSPKAFGTLTIKAVVTKAVAGLGSAQAFGAVAIKTARITPVTGVPSAQAFGITAPKASIKVAVAGIPSAKAFGAVTIRTGSSVVGRGRSLGEGVRRDQAIYRVQAPGLGSAQTFGVFTLKARITKPVAGVGSAQQFGSITGRVRNIWIWPTTYFPSTGGSITNRVICGDGHTVGGWDYLPASGRSRNPGTRPARGLDPRSRTDAGQVRRADG